MVDGLGIDVIFPAAMAGLAVLLISGRRELVAAGAGAAIGVVVSLTVSTTAGVIAGGVLGPFVGLLVPPAKARGTEAIAVSDVTDATNQDGLAPR